MTALIFDLDGTLIDSAPDIHVTANQVMAEHGLSPLDFPTVRSFIGHGVAHLVARLLQAHGRSGTGPQAEAMIDRFGILYRSAFAHTRVYPGVAEALARLAPHHRLGICTNKPLAATHAVLDHFGLAGLFATVVGGDSLPQRKPDPAPLLLALSQLGGGPAVYIGDSEVDAATAQAAGLPFALFTEGYRKTAPEQIPHQISFADFNALPAILQPMIAPPAPV